MLASCAPGKSDRLVRVDIYCDSCYAKVESRGYYGDPSDYQYISEIPFDREILDYQQINIFRFDSPIDCIRIVNYYSYTTDTVDIYFIENNDTILEEHRLSAATTYCY